LFLQTFKDLNCKREEHDLVWDVLPPLFKKLNFACFMSICISFFGMNINPKWCETTAKFATNSGRKLHFYTIKEMYAITRVYPSKTSRKKTLYSS
jgi:hypothetical protein